jgi:hypothetical protein
MVECSAGNWQGFSMRFTIRDLLLVMVIVGLAAGWAIDSRRTRTQFEVAKSLLRQYEWKVRVHAPHIWYGSVMPALGPNQAYSLRLAA